MTSLSIPLKQGFSAKVKVGDKVISGQVIASRITSGKDHQIHVAHLLGIPAVQSSKYLIKKPGDRVEEGFAVAVKKGALGMGAKKAVSPVSGTVFSFDQNEGVLVVRTADETETQDLFSPVDGEVSLCDNEKIVIKTDKSGIPVLKATGVGRLEGELIVIHGESVEAGEVKIDVQGKIAGGKKFNREAIAKTLGLGAIGIIAGDIADEDFEDLEKKMVKNPVIAVGDEIDKVLKSDGKKIHADPVNKTIILQNE